MTEKEIELILSEYNPDHYPNIHIKKEPIWEEQFLLDDISIIKFHPTYYNGDWECYCPRLFDDVYRASTLIGIIDFLLSLHPALLYSKPNHPELFL